MQDNSVFQSQLADKEVRKELAESVFVEETLNEMPGNFESVKSIDLSESVDQIADGKSDPTRPDVLEAIVMRHGYPSLLISDGDYEKPKLKVWQERLDPNRKEIKDVIQGVGRVELVGHPDAKWVGTCWLVDEQTLVTNRHVADFFTDIKRNGKISIQRGVKAYVDFREEHLSQEELEYLIASVSFIEQAERDIDMALMKLDPNAVKSLKLQPIPIAKTHENSEFIGVVGYPARDSRNPIQDMSRIFKDIYNVKRLAPGKVMDPKARSKVFTHNCTTLGGNSGSIVFDIATGEAIGLHFAGSALDANYAVNTHWLKDRLKKNSIQVPDSNSSSDESGDEIELEANDDFGDRDGYQVDFLGDDELRVPLPRLNELQARDVAITNDGESVLKYRHFSVVMSKRRRLAYYSAANVDGSNLRRPRRVGFKIDPRLDREQQADNDLYRGNDLDRGHLIRRLDPCWGSASEASQANKDSNFYTNIGPQHKDLNQKTWLDLEEHILENTDDENAKISVFVGCVFDEDDPPHVDTGIKVPMGFWKVVASTTRRRRGRRTVPELQTQAFIFSQEHLVQQDDLELIFGGVEGVQQITVVELERVTGLDFGVMRDADTFGLDPDFEEGIDFESPTEGRTAHYRLLDDASDMV